MTEILSLSTVVKRDTIHIKSKRHPDGKHYELVNLADLGPYEHARIFHLDDEQKKMQAKKRLTKKDVQRLEQILDETMNLVVPSIEPAVLSELTSQQKQTVILTWSYRLIDGAAEGNAEARPSTTARSSRASKPSMGATRQPGSTARRGS